MFDNHAWPKGERQFVEDLRAFHDDGGDYFKTRDVYLLRNMSRGRGVGFFEAGNFHPDFILWTLAGDRQHVAFVDPKGIRNIGGLTDPKIHFHKTIKDIEHRLGNPSICLHSYIVSNTPSHVVNKLWGIKRSVLEEHNVLFQEEDKDGYIRKMFKATE